MNTFSCVLKIVLCPIAAGILLAIPAYALPFGQPETVDPVSSMILLALALPFMGGAMMLIACAGRNLLFLPLEAYDDMRRKLADVFERDVDQSDNPYRSPENL